MNLRPLLLNGRFLGQPVTGVQRLAIELTRAIRAELRMQGQPDIMIAVPKAISSITSAAKLGRPTPVITAIGRLGGHVWEQIELAPVHRDAWLLSLCNVGPMFRRRQALVICDAQFILHPESYSWAFRTWYRILLTVLSRRAAAVFTISQFSRSVLEHYGIVPKHKLNVLKLGVDHLGLVDTDPTILARQKLSPRSYILAIGSLARHKNLAVLIDAFIAADLPSVTLVIAGGGNARVFQRAGLREAPNIQYTGRVADGELKALYANALAFACPSLSEGFGFTPLEALAMGCPVIATTGGAVPEVCGDAAIFANPNDRDEWRDALRSIVSDKTLRDGLAGRAFNRANEFKWGDTARQMLSVLATQDNAMPLTAAVDQSDTS